MRAAFLAAAVVLFLPLAGARAGEAAPPLRLSFLGQDLVLNGFGAREVLGRPIYVCALYVAKAGASADEVADPRTPTALRLEVLYEHLPADIPRAWKRRIGPELDIGQMRALKAAYSKLGAGDVAFIAHAPDRGTTVAINDHPILTDSGHGLMAAFLGLWLGPEAESDELRQALLSAPGG